MTSIQLTAKASRLRGRFNDVMATRRAYAASFGTGAALVACAALLFVLASAIVAFNGLPRDGGALAPVTVSAGALHAPVSTPAATRLAAFAAFAAAPAGAAGAAGAGGGATRAGGVVVRPPRRGAVGRGTATRRPGSVGGVRPVLSASRASVVAAACCSSGSVVGRVTGIGTGTVRQAARTAGRTTASTVTSVGQTASTMTGTGSVVGGVIGGLGAK